MTDINADDRDFQLLSDYLVRLQSGQRPDREAFLREHPQLASSLDCLEALENLAAEPEQTVPWEISEQTEILPAASELPRAFGSYQLICEIGPRRHGRGL